MYKVESIEIDGFWQRFKATQTFHESVNIVIGRNGSGKTTFIDILESVLSVDMSGLSENEFAKVTIRLRHGKTLRTIRATRLEQSRSPFQIMRYQISRKAYFVRIVGGDEIRFSPTIRRRIDDEAQEVRSELASLISLASLSVYRNRPDADLQGSDRRAFRSLSPVDVRLGEMMKNLTRYLLELSQSAQAISSALQRTVLLSLLYEPSQSKMESRNQIDSTEAQSRLLSAYEQLGLSGHRGLKARIKSHVDAVDKQSELLKRYIGGEKELDVDFAPLDMNKITEFVVSESLKAKEETSKIYSQRELFLEIIGDFIHDKRFSFLEGDLIIEKDGKIPFSKMSSGEKQLLILLVEALLQRQRPYLFIADEPELSLHVEWQRKILPAVQRLNPSAQIIVATHSPEIAGKYRDYMIDMDDVLDVSS